MYIRLVEQKLAESKKLGLIKGPVHLGVGQEAVAVAVSSYLIIMIRSLVPLVSFTYTCSEY